jgi:hypothetical protein
VKFLLVIFIAQVIANKAIPPAKMITDQQYGFPSLTIFNLRMNLVKILPEHPPGIQPEKGRVKRNMSGSDYGQNNL